MVRTIPSYISVIFFLHLVLTFTFIYMGETLVNLYSPIFPSLFRYFLRLFQSVISSSICEVKREMNVLIEPVY